MPPVATAHSGSGLGEASRRRAAARGVALLLFVEVVVFTLSTVPGVRARPGFDGWLDGWLQGSAYVTAAVLCLLHPATVRAGRRAWSWIAAALVMRAAAFVIFLTIVRRLDPQPYPSAADVGWLLMPLLMVVGIVELTAGRGRSVSARLITDSAVGGLAAVALGLWAMDGTLRRLATDGLSTTVVTTNLAYPVTDVLLVLAVLGSIAVSAWRPPRDLVLLGMGTVGFAICDAIFLQQVTSGTFRPGTLLSALSLVSTACIAGAPWVSRGRAVADARPFVSSVVVPVIGTLACLVVLVLGATDSVPLAAILLASAGLTLAVLRAALTFRRLQQVTTELSDSEAALRQGESRIQAESKRVRAIIDGVAGHAVIGGSPSRGITFFSAGAEEMLGYTADEVVGRVGVEVFHLEAEIDEAAAEFGVPPGPELFAVFADVPAREWTWVRKDGTHLPVLISNNFMRGTEDTEDEFVAIARDVSREVQLKRYRSTREALVSTLNSGPEPLGSALRVIGEGMGWEFAALWLPEAGSLRCVERWQGTSTASPSVASEISSVRLRAGEGVVGRAWQRAEPVWIEDLAAVEGLAPTAEALRDRLVPGSRTLVALPLPGHQRSRPTGVLQVVGRRRARDEEVLDLLDAIALTIGHHIATESAAGDLRAARDAADLANQAKSAFVSRISHELRTPMNAVLGFAQLVSADLDDERQRDRIAQVLGAGRHLTSMIDDLLDVSQVESGELRLAKEPVLATSVLTEVLDLTGPLIAERGLEVELDAHDGLYRFVEADFLRLRQVLLNLVSNAVKYNRRGGKIRLAFEQPAAGRLRYLVTDTGVGITESDLPNLFRPFERMAAEGGPESGAGLGLSISRGLVEAMGGELGLSSTSTSGSTFYVELQECDPALPGTAERPAKGFQPPAGLAAPSATVLLIEDNPVNVRLLEDFFSTQPRLALRVARDGASGLRSAAGARPDLILLDLHLPDRHGLDVLQQLRSAWGTSQIPVIVVSAHAGDELRRRCMTAGAAEYLTKPLDLSVLSGAIATVLSLPKGSDEIEVQPRAG